MMDRNRRPAVELSDDERKALQKEIAEYFRTERGEDLGVIASGAILDFFIETLGCRFYNAGLKDARSWFESRLEGLDTDFFSLLRN